MSVFEALGLTTVVLVAKLIPVIQIIAIIVAVVILKRILAKSQNGENYPKLERTSNNKIVAGVCGGIAKYFNIDPTIIRCLWALTTAFAGIGITAYIICWIIIPKETYCY